MSSKGYGILAEYYEKIENTAKRLEKIGLIAELLKNTDKDDKRMIILLLQGRAFPEWDERKIGVSEKLILKALAAATGNSQESISREFRKTGDLGNTSENLIGTKEQSTLFSSELTIKKVFGNIEKLSSLEGSGTMSKKVQLISELFTSARPLEARYICRTILGDLRVGASFGTIRDGIISCFFPKEYAEREGEGKGKFQEISGLVQRAYDLTNDLSDVVSKIEEKGIEGLNDVHLTPLRPVNSMLFFKAKNIEEAFDIVGRPAFLEYKYDGFRVQIHKKGDEVRLFTRRLENVTKQFPDIVSAVNKEIKCNDAIIDSEVLGIDEESGTLLPFQNISQRIRRKHDIEKMAKSIPVIVMAFDILKKNEEDMLDIGFSERRKILEQSIEEDDKHIIRLSEAKKTDSEEDANSFYETSLLQGHEGMMVKSLDKGYKPGSRVGYAVKIKPVLESLDLVITKAEWGHGKRAGWLTSYTVACKDNGRFLDIGKVGTGVKELEDDNRSLTFKRLTKMIEPLMIKDRGTHVEIRPEIIAEIDYEEIQSSNTYDSGFALRFPRIKRLREDIGEPSTVDDVKRIYKEQRGRE